MLLKDKWKEIARIKSGDEQTYFLRDVILLLRYENKIMAYLLSYITCILLGIIVNLSWLSLILSIIMIVHILTLYKRMVRINNKYR